VLFYLDGNSENYLQCGNIPGVYPTIDFGTGVDVYKAFSIQRKFAPFGPLINSEFYPGWLDLWGSNHSTVKTANIIKTFNEIMSFEMSNVNFYMYHGGTNFGFSNGADPDYLPQPTTYDYDAPITEAGDITDKYLQLRNEISKYLPLPKVPIPSNSTKVALGIFQMNYYFSLIDAITQFSGECFNLNYPSTFEMLGQGYGFIMYSTQLDTLDVDNKVLSIPGIRDRGYIQIGNRSVGVLYRKGQTSIKINLKNNQNNTLYIIVENMGRLNFGNPKEIYLDAKVIPFHKS
jgi:beta-galactosidase